MATKKEPVKSMAEIAWVPIIVALIGVFGSIGVAWITATRTASEQIKPVVAASIGPQSSGQKLCSAWVKNTYRDSMIVPQQWKIDTCKKFMVAISANLFQVGCVYEDRIAWGDEGGGVPADNCGW
ncbi:hypothetical protein [Bradyrhizobium japonicum]|uniref:hypothetical protein n=1 Tax=Bradyrhizobium japonicum TaxID=375 RepID=UPI00126A2FDB|nr:hypothetical protein [Bradyrhizobium japonicum]